MKDNIIIYKGDNIFSTLLLCTNWDRIHFDGDVFLDPEYIKYHYTCEDDEVEFLMNFASGFIYHTEHNKVFCLKINEFNNIQSEVENFLTLNDIIT
jgi:hypothetical protein